MNAETSFTPGPWVIADTKAGSWFVSAQNDWCICSRLSTVEHMEQQSYANARLIAAAPRMLAALQSAEIVAMELCIGQDPANQCWVVLQQIRDAIAKASQP